MIALARTFHERQILFFFFFLNYPAPPEIYPLSLPHALPIPTIRMYHAARPNRPLHEGHQTARRSVRDATHANASDAPALFLCRHDNQCLALRFAAPQAL